MTEQDQVDIASIKDAFINEHADEQLIDDSSTSEKNDEENPTVHESPDASSDDHENSNELQETPEEEELWDLSAIITPTQLVQSPPIACSTANCPLQACSVWISSNKSKEPWPTCLDCQAADFGGWPEERGEIPLKVLRGEHWKLILERCTLDAVVCLLILCFV